MIQLFAKAKTDLFFNIVSLSVHMSRRNGNDSVIFDSRRNGRRRTGNKQNGSGVIAPLAVLLLRYNDK